MLNPTSALSKATLNYLLAFAFAALFGVMSYSGGDAGGLVALKTILAPFYVLACRAVPTFFREPIVEPRWTGRAIEAHILEAALFAGFMTLVFWKPDLTATAIVINFLWCMMIMGVTQMIILYLRIRRLRNGEA